MSAVVVVSVALLFCLPIVVGAVWLVAVHDRRCDLRWLSVRRRGRVPILLSMAPVQAVYSTTHGFAGQQSHTSEVSLINPSRCAARAAGMVPTERLALALPATRIDIDASDVIGSTGSTPQRLIVMAFTWAWYRLISSILPLWPATGLIIFQGPGSARVINSPPLLQSGLLLVWSADQPPRLVAVPGWLLGSAPGWGIRNRSLVRTRAPEKTTTCQASLPIFLHLIQLGI